MIELGSGDYPLALMGGFTQFGAQDLHITRTVPFYVLIIVLENQLTFTENGQEVVLNKKDWYIQEKNSTQSATCHSPDAKFYYIHFDIMKYASEFFSRKITIPKCGTFDDLTFSRYEVLMDEIEQSDHTLMIQSTFLQFMSDLEEINKDAPLCLEIARYLSKTYHKSLHLKDLQKLTHYSKDHLTRIFKDHYGCTPYKYLNNIRIRESKSLLLSTNLTLESIAHKVGFSDLSLYYKNFKMREGISPGKWRTKMLSS